MANRLHISIRCQLRKKFHHFQFDHQAKFGCCFSYCVHACRRSQLPRTQGCWHLAPWDCGVDAPLETLLCHVLPYQIWSLQVALKLLTCLYMLCLPFGRRQGVPKISEMLGSRPLAVGTWLTLEICFSPTCVTLPNSVILSQIFEHLLWISA